MGNRLTTFQNLLEQQLRASQSIIVHLVRIEEILGDIRDGRILAIPETIQRLSSNNLSTINEEFGNEYRVSDDTLTNSSDSETYLEQAIV